MRQRASDGHNAGDGRQLSAVTADIVNQPCENGAGAVPVSGQTPEHKAVSLNSRPPALRGYRIPSRNAGVRRRVVGLYDACTWLTVADLPAAVRWAVLFARFVKMAEHLDKLPVVKVSDADAEPRKLDGELRATSAELSRLEQSLGVTASARSALGLNLTRMGRLAQDGPGDALDQADILTLEERVLSKLGVGTGDSTDDGETDEGASDGIAGHGGGATV